MAYGIKYRFQWRSPMREHLTYDVIIREEGYEGGINPLYPSGDALIITQGAIDDSELVPIKPTEMEFTLLCKDDGEPYSEFYTLDPKRFRVEVSECDDMQCRKRWIGYIATGDYMQPCAKPPYQVTIRANDGFGILKAMPYLDANGENFSQDRTVRQLIDFLLSPLDEMPGERLAYIWDFEKLSAKQSEHSFDLMSISDSTIYTVFGEEAPTYYDVLEAVLSNFGLQLFQNYGEWEVRSLGQLLRSGARGDIEVATLYNGKEGLSTDATLSFVPPLNKLKVDGEDSNSVVLNDMYKSSLWSAERMVDSGVYKPLKDAIVQNHFNRLFLKLGSTTGATAWFTLPGTVSYSASTRLKFSAKLYFERVSDYNPVRVGVWISDARYKGSSSIDVIRNRNFTDMTVIANTTVLASNPSVTGWKKVESGSWRDTFDDTTSTLITLSSGPAGYGYNGVGYNASRERYAEHLIEIITDGIPVYNEDVKEWEVHILFACRDAASSVSFWIDEPTIEVVEDNAITTEQSRDIQISDLAIEDAAYSPAFNSVRRLNVSSDVFAPAVHYAGSKRPVYGCLTPASKMSFAHVIGSNLKEFRNTVSRQIEGDLYHSLDNGLNSLFKEDRRTYYVNYSRWLPARGLRNVQLREATALSPLTSAVMPSTYSGVSKVWSIDDSIFFIPASGGSLVRYDAITDTYSKVTTLDGTETIAVGVNAICVNTASVVDGVKNATLTAYNKYGKRVSQLYELTSPYVTDSEWKTAMLSARYDLDSKVWVTRFREKTTITVKVYDDSGYELVTTQQTISSASSIEEIILFSGGYVIPILTNKTYSNYWLSYSIHTGKILEVALSGSFKIVAVSDTAVVCLNANSAVMVYERTSPVIDYTSSNQLFFNGRASFGDIQINSAIISFADASGNVYIYDLRSEQNVQVSFLPISGYALCGSRLYTFGERNVRSITGYRL